MTGGGGDFTPRTARAPTSNGDGGRPMTSVRAAGYSTRGKPGGYTQNQHFDPFNQAGGLGHDLQVIDLNVSSQHA